MAQTPKTCHRVISQLSSEMMSESLKCFYTAKSKDIAALLSLPTIKDDSSSTDDDVVQKVQSKLTTSKLGQTILFNSELSSTQTILHEQLRLVAPDGTICWTDIQTKGKGRGSNAWDSPTGCLMFSFTNEFHNGQQLPFVQYLISLAIIKAIHKTINGVVDTEQPLFQIKWPNDIYGKKNKIGGILCQSDYMNGSFRVTTGMGINLDNSDPTTCINDIIKEEYGNEVRPITKTDLLVNICNLLEPMQQRFNIDGFEPFQQEYKQYWMHTDQQVTLQDNRQDLPVKIQGLTTSGCLLAIAEDGTSYELYPDGNSLDFFNGLLKRKLSN